MTKRTNDHRQAISILNVHQHWRSRLEEDID